MHPISKVNGAGPVIAAMLAEKGITTAEQLLKRPLADIAALPRVGMNRAQNMMDAARALVAASGKTSQAGAKKKKPKATKAKKADKKSKTKKADKIKAGKKESKARKADKDKTGKKTSKSKKADKKKADKKKTSKKAGKSKSKKKKK